MWLSSVMSAVGVMLTIESYCGDASVPSHLYGAARWHGPARRIHILFWLWVAVGSSGSGCWWTGLPSCRLHVKSGLNVKDFFLLDLLEVECFVQQQIVRFIY